jgi:hypothetical protein
MLTSVVNFVTRLLKLKTSKCLADVSVRANRGDDQKDNIVLNDIEFTRYVELERVLIASKELKAVLVDNNCFNKFVNKVPDTAIKIKELTIPHEQSVKTQVEQIKLEIPPYTVTITISWI